VVLLEAPQIPQRIGVGAFGAMALGFRRDRHAPKVGLTLYPGKLTGMGPGR